MPLVNNLLKTPDEPHLRWPLKVVFCRACSLAQLTETPPPDAMFGEYLYFSSQSQTMVAHAAQLVKQFVRPGDRVLEIASNDGYLLKPAQHSARARRRSTLLKLQRSRHSHALPVFQRANRTAYRRRVGSRDVLFANNVLARAGSQRIAAGIAAVSPQRHRTHRGSWLVQMISRAIRHHLSRTSVLLLPHIPEGAVQSARFEDH
jgi:hypothetical protein